MSTRAGEILKLQVVKPPFTGRVPELLSSKLILRVVCNEEHIRSLAYDFEPCNVNIITVLGRTKIGDYDVKALMFLILKRSYLKYP
jgi:hypothetical protein